MMGRVRATLTRWFRRRVDRAHDRHCPCAVPLVDDPDTVQVRNVLGLEVEENGHA